MLTPNSPKARKKRYMDDEQILSKGGTEEDIKRYAKENGADLDEDIELGEN